MYLYEVFVCVFGATIGSFLNVCIYRIPASLSIVRPASRCPVCEQPIRWYQNIPIVSWLVLRGRCSGCRTRISPRYPAVEALTALIFWLIYDSFGMHPAVPVFWLFAAALIVITFIDLDHQIIPDVISLPGIVVGLLLSFFVPWLQWHESLIGIVAGGGSLWLVAAGYEFLAKKEGMGGGDIKLLAMIGAFLGWKSILPVVFLSSFVGTMVGVPLMLLRRSDGKLAIPFGPFLSAATLIWLLWGRELLRWYLNLMVG